MNLEIKRHSLSHILAQAVKEIYPDVKFGVGPAVDDGFYYDFDFGEVEFSESDLKNVEKKMKKIISQNQKFEQFVLPINEAITKLNEEGEIYKKELALKLKLEGESELSFYKNISQQWDVKFVDMCRGPHVEKMSELDVNSFKLVKVAGAYWLGNSDNKMLTRIYAYAFNNKEELDAHLKMIEEAKKRDHRIIWKKMDIFSFNDNVGLWLPLWHPMGGRLWRTIEDYWLAEHTKWGYEFVRTPHIWNKKLWETSGHWGFYSDSMYPPIEVGQTLEDAQAWKAVDKELSEQYLLKPMNCPFHVEIYKHSPKSYRELPLKWAELGTVYRYEKRGQLGWLTRVRWFTQDDAHIFCSREQVKEEFAKVVDFIDNIIKTFGLDYKAYLSFRDKESEKYVGSDEMWDLAQNVLKEVAEEKWLNAPIEEWEAAFYWPKIDFRIKDCLGREHQCSTVQFDFNLPERFWLTFTNKDWEQEQPFMIHRALLWSFERFISVLIENYAGIFPLWIAPRQTIIIPVAEKFDNYAKKINAELISNSVKSEIDFSSDSFNKKIRNAEKSHINYILIVWENEEKNWTISVRNYKTKDQTIENTSEFITRILEEINDKI